MKSFWHLDTGQTLKSVKEMLFPIAQHVTTTKLYLSIKTGLSVQYHVFPRLFILYYISDYKQDTNLNCLLFALYSTVSFCDGSFCDGSFCDGSLLRPLSSRTEHSRLVVHHCRNTRAPSLLSITVATQESLLCLVRFFSGMHVLLLFLF